LLLAYLHFPLSNGYLIVEVLDYSVLPCFIFYFTISLLFLPTRFYDNFKRVGMQSFYRTITANFNFFVYIGI